MCLGHLNPEHMVSSLRQCSQDAGKSQLQWGVMEERAKVRFVLQGVRIEATGKTV